MLRVDLHVHSNCSHDGIDSVMSLAEAARDVGIAAIAICDHNMCTPLPESAPVMLIPGTEISTLAGHILGIFLERPIDYHELSNGELPSAEAAINAIHSAGGLAVLAHPFERLGADEKYLCGLDIDLVETANSRDSMKVCDAGERAEKLADLMGKPSVGGSDAHDCCTIGICYTDVEIDSDNLFELRRALELGRCRAVRVRNTMWKEKARSQWVSARRSGSIRRMVRAAVYVALSPIRDALQR